MVLIHGFDELCTTKLDTTIAFKKLISKIKILNFVKKKRSFFKSLSAHPAMLGLNENLENIAQVWRIHEDLRTTEL